MCIPWRSCCCCHSSLLTQIHVSQIRFLTWEIPADRYRRICVHMWKLGRVPSLLCYTEDTESVSWASPGTCSRTPALLFFTLSVYWDWRLLLSSAIRRWRSAYMFTDIHLPTTHRLALPNRRYCSFSASSFEQHGSIHHQDDSLNPTVCLYDEAVNAALELFDETKMMRAMRHIHSACREEHWQPGDKARIPSV